MTILHLLNVTLRNERLGIYQATLPPELLGAWLSAMAPVLAATTPAMTAPTVEIRYTGALELP